MKKIKIDQEKCIGCGLCVSIAEKVFRMNEQGKSEMIDPPSSASGEISARQGGKIQEAIDACPVSAISWKEE